MNTISFKQLKSTKEYIANYRYAGTDTYRFIVDKVVKDSKGNVESITITIIDPFHKTETFTLDEWCFENVREPISSTEFFVMYTNWNNFFKEGVHQDLGYAKKISKNIHNSLRFRSTVKQGSGKLEEYDNLLLNKFLKQTYGY